MLTQDKLVAVEDLAETFKKRAAVELEIFINADGVEEQQRSLGRLEATADMIRYLEKRLLGRL